MRVWGAGLCLFLAVSAYAAPLAPELSPEAIAHIEALLASDAEGRNRQADEQLYQRLVQPQTFADLALLYAPENRRYLSIAYARFTPEGGKPGKDLGFGLHVVKRLRLPLGDGTVKVIDVNEHWPENGADGGLLFPDEIRVKTLAFSGDGHGPGSHARYLFDSFRLAWDENDGIEIHRRTRFEYDAHTGKNRLRSMRSPVSAPFLCQNCHAPNSTFKKLAADFLESEAPLQYDAIVQDGYFRRPLREMLGYQEYVAHLETSGRDPAFIARVEETLADPFTAAAVPGILPALRKQLGAFSWLGSDLAFPEGVVPPGFPPAERRQGMYFRRGVWNRDALEDAIVGKYVWWSPQSVIPTHARRR